MTEGEFHSSKKKTLEDEMAPESSVRGGEEAETDYGDAAGHSATDRGQRESHSSTGGDEASSAEGADADAKELAALDVDDYRELKERAQKSALFLDELRRTKAELENFRKRVRRERPNWEDLAVRQFLKTLLPVFDNFELAINSSAEGETDLESFRQGVQMIDVLLQKTLEDYGVEEIPALGETFDPEVHEAVIEVEVDDRPTGEVVDVEQKGYLYKGVVVRPSRVHVARNRQKDKR